MAKFESFTDLINYIRHDMLPEEMSIVNVSFDDHSIIMEFYEDNIPIIIEYHKVYDMLTGFEWRIEAELFIELVERNLTSTELAELGEICAVLNLNADIFVGLIKRKE